MENKITNKDLLFKCFLMHSNRFSEKNIFKLRATEEVSSKNELDNVKKLLKYQLEYVYSKYVVFRTRKQFENYANQLKANLEAGMYKHDWPTDSENRFEDSVDSIYGNQYVCNGGILDLYDDCDENNSKSLVDLRDLNLKKSNSSLSLSSVASALNCRLSSTKPIVKKMHKLVVADFAYTIRRYRKPPLRELLEKLTLEDDIINFLDFLNKLTTQKKNLSSADEDEILKQAIRFLYETGYNFPVCDVNMCTLEVRAVEVGSYEISDKNDLQMYAIDFLIDNKRGVLKRLKPNVLVYGRYRHVEDIHKYVLYTDESSQFPLRYNLFNAYKPSPYLRHIIKDYNTDFVSIYELLIFNFNNSSSLKKPQPPTETDQTKWFLMNGIKFLDKLCELKNLVRQDVRLKRRELKEIKFFDFDTFWDEEIYKSILVRENLLNLDFFQGLSHLFHMNTSRMCFQRLFELDIKYLSGSENLHKFLFEHMDPKNCIYLFYFDHQLIKQDQELLFHLIEAFSDYLGSVKLLNQKTDKKVIAVLINYDNHVYLEKEKLFFKKCFFIEQAFKNEPNYFDTEDQVLDFRLQERIALNDIDLNATKSFKINLNYNSLVILNEFHFKSSPSLSVYLEELHFNQNNLFYLSPFTFERFYSLKVLILRNNQLKKLPASLFSDLTRLEVLDLSKNLLSDSALQKNVFGNLKNLKILDLNSNAFKELDKDLFSNLASLILLDLGNNKLRCLHRQLFKNLIELQFLNLGYNKIVEFEDGQVFSSIRHLTILCLNNNLISELKKYWFENLTSLRVMFLHLNDFVSLSSDECSSFRKLINLNVLSLFNDSLHLDKELRSKLELKNYNQKIKYFLRKISFSKKSVLKCVLNSDTINLVTKPFVESFIKQNLV